MKYKYINNEEKIIISTSAIHFITHFYMLIFPAIVIPLHNYLNIPIEKIIPISGLMYLFYGLGSLPAGIIADKWQSKTLLAISLIGIGGASILAGLSTNLTMLFISLSIIGLFCSVYHPAGMSLISKGCSKRGKALGLNGIFGSLGIASAPIITGFITYFFNWNTVYFIAAIPVLVLSILLFLTDIKEISVHHSDSEKKTLPRKYLYFFLILCICMMLGGVIYRGITVILPTFFSQKVSFFSNILEYVKIPNSRNLAATTLTTIVYLFGMAGQYIGGKAADRFDLRKVYFLFFLIQLPLMILISILSNYTLFAVVMIYNIFMFGIQPVENSIVAKFTPPSFRGTGYGLKFIFTFGIGSVAVKLISYIMKQYSIESIFIFQSGIIIILLICIGFLYFLSRKETIRNN